MKRQWCAICQQIGIRRWAKTTITLESCDVVNVCWHHYQEFTDPDLFDTVDDPELGEN